MSEARTPQDKLTLDTNVRHRSAASLETTVSGVADSAISFNTYATGVTAESLRLSQFPPPPSAIPSSPSDTIARSNFSSTPPYSPIYRTPPSTTFSHSTSPLVPRKQGSGTSAATVQASVPSPSAPASDLPARSQYPPPPALHDHPLSSSLTRSSTSTERAPHSGFNSDRMFSPYDWHEGSSSISVDPNEERLLSTSFITGLLGEAGSASRETVTGGFSHGYGSSTRPEADVDTLVSELTYPPARVVQPPQFSQQPPAYSESRRLPTVPSSLHNTLSASSHEGGVAEAMRGSEDIAVGSNSRATYSGPVQERPLSVDSGFPSSIARSTNSPVTFDSHIPLRLHRSPSSAVSNELEGEGQDALGVSYAGASSMLFSPAAPSSAGIRPNSKSPQRRQSAASYKTSRSQAPSFISKLSNSTAGQAVSRTMDWFRVKPLPPVPRLPNVTLAQEREHRRAEEAQPLPALAARADRLHHLIDAGRLPHHSVGSFSHYGSPLQMQKQMQTGGYLGVPGSSTDLDRMGVAHASGRDEGAGGRKRASLHVDAGQWVEGSASSPSKQRRFRIHQLSELSRPDRIKLMVCLSVVALLALVGIIVGVIVGRKAKHSSSSCSGNLTGNACNLDATCVCTSSSQQCNPLAQSVLDLTSTANKLFDGQLTPNSVANAMFAVQGAPVNGNCAVQANVIDVAPGLDSTTSPNRTQWAQSALLWSFVKSQDPTSVKKLQSFVVSAKWSSLSAADGPVQDSSSEFETTLLGFTYDFAGQTLSEPEVSFQTDGQPSSAQVAQVSSAAKSALDRMYSFAAASSNQQQMAMQQYWRSVLQQDPKNFNLFVSLVISSPILLPFDANAAPGNINISSLLTNSTSAPFPPPLACYPGLSSSQQQLINSVETTVFGLSLASTQSKFDTSCFPDRPVYGVLDLLRLRLPFHDSVPNVARQAATLIRDATPRVIVYNGPILSALPASSSTNVSSTMATDPLQFGTLNHINHVLLNFFAVIPDIKVAIALVEYVLSDPAGPPKNDSALAQALDSIPVLEVAVFGAVTPGDISGAVSSFATPSGGLFFGTDQSLALRDWAINGAQSSVAWSASANGAQVVRDGSFTDGAFNSVWDPAFSFFHSATTSIVDVGNITSSFQAVGKFSN